MEQNRRFATWTGVILGLFLAVVLNIALAHASHNDNDEAVVTEEFHHTYPLTANAWNLRTSMVPFTFPCGTATK